MMLKRTVMLCLGVAAAIHRLVTIDASICVCVCVCVYVFMLCLISQLFALFRCTHILSQSTIVTDLCGVKRV